MVGKGKLFKNCRRQIVDVDVEKESQDRSLKNAIFQFALLAVTGSKGKTSDSDKLHNHFIYVFIRQKSQQLAGKAIVPDSVVCRCHVGKNDTSLFSLKKI